MRILWLLTASTLLAQNSPETTPDSKITFRLLAPNADTVAVVRGDMPGATPTFPMTKNADGLWETTVGPFTPGAYRYRFTVNGVTTVDPRNPASSESNNDIWSLALVPGSEIFDTKQVPHGAVAAVTYYSTELKRARRMTVYTPPGYESGKGKYPVFYLLHGSSDSDASWSTVGRAGVILDNLIAAKKAKPMIVVMPHGHTSRAPRVQGAPDDFPNEFMADILPYIEKNYRTQPGRAARAIAGLSMGGGHTLAIGIPHLNQFAYLGVFSSSARPTFEEQNAAALDNAAWKKGLKLFWIATGKEDAGLKRTQDSVAMFKKHGFTVEYKESERGHVWLNWRDYLAEFAPRLFQ